MSGNQIAQPLDLRPTGFNRRRHGRQIAADDNRHIPAQSFPAPPGLHSKHTPLAKLMHDVRRDLGHPITIDGTSARRTPRGRRLNITEF